MSKPILTDSSASGFNIAKFNLNEPQVRQPHVSRKCLVSQRRLKGEFIKAVPLQWLAPVVACPGKVLAVALAIWFQFGRCKEKPFKLTSAILKRFSVSRKARYHGLKELEKLGLITVQRQAGKNPVVTVNFAQ